MYIDLSEGVCYREVGWDASRGVVGGIVDAVIARWAAVVTTIPPPPADHHHWIVWATTQAQAWVAWLHTLHPGDDADGTAAVQLRIWRDGQQIRLAVCGMVAALDETTARHRAQHQATCATCLFPAAYGVQVVRDPAQFAHVLRDAWLDDQDANALLAVRRGEWFPVFENPDRVWEQNYLLEPPPWSLHGLATTLRAVDHTAEPVVVTVTATPTTLYAEEERDLAVLYSTAQTLHSQPRLRAHLAGRWGVRGYAGMLARWRRPWRLAVQAAGAITPLVGAALLADHTPTGEPPTDDDGDRGPLAQPELCQPHPSECMAARAAMQHGQLIPWGTDLAAPRYRRFRELADGWGVAHALRVPPITPMINDQ